VQYLLQKTSELKKARANYNAYLEKLRSQKQQEADKKQQEKVQAFEDTQKATASSKKRSREDEPEKNALSVSYWLADFQPEHEGSVPDPPPERPPSPHSGQPLRLKDLRSLSIKRSSDGKPICALSDKSITTQPVVAVKEDVILEECFNDLVKPSMLHPITGDKLKSKHILKLQKGKSGFASSGPVEAKTYRPTIT
jgi:nitric oxide synthase-interacting protein